MSNLLKKSSFGLKNTFTIMDGGDLTSTPMSAKPTFWRGWMRIFFRWLRNVDNGKGAKNWKKSNPDDVVNILIVEIEGHYNDKLTDVTQINA